MPICSDLLPPLPGISVGSRHNLITLAALLGGFFTEIVDMFLKHHGSLFTDVCLWGTVLRNGHSKGLSVWQWRLHWKFYHYVTCPQKLAYRTYTLDRSYCTTTTWPWWTPCFPQSFLTCPRCNITLFSLEGCQWTYYRSLTFVQTMSEQMYYHIRVTFRGNKISRFCLGLTFVEK